MDDSRARTNTPRDQMNGPVERFGGMWNGYTWIDQTMYPDTAGRDALDQCDSKQIARSWLHPELIDEEELDLSGPGRLRQRRS
jgi:hypothetical protein